MDEAGIEALQEAIKNMHGCSSDWVRSVPVHEMFNGQTVWQGEVQVFQVFLHPKTDRCYAWSYATEGTRRRFVAVLEIGPVIDAVTAVRAVIASDARRGGK